MLYALVALPALVALVSLAVDYGRVQAAKGELQLVADSAARYGIAGLSTSVATAESNAVAAAADNTVDGAAFVLQTSDIEFGTWTEATQTFVVLTGTSRSGANAIRVTARRTRARGNAIQLSFMGMLGIGGTDITATSVASRTGAGSSAAATVPGNRCLWLAGMPSGTSAGNGDSAPNQSPNQITGITLVPGTSISFDVTGSVSNLSYLVGTSPDGDASSIVNNQNTSGQRNGIANVRVPLNCLIGVFLDDNQPNWSATPAALDFSTSGSRNYTSLSPLLKQPFFIGDGVNSNGVDQMIVVPPGATRLYLGGMDAFEWNNNVGSFTVTVTGSNGAIATVR
jgi:Flp pilus assembly protein TadG